MERARLRVGVLGGRALSSFAAGEFSAEALDRGDAVESLVDPGAVDAGAAVDDVSLPVPGAEDVVAGPTQQDIPSAAALDPVVPRPADQEVVAGAAVDDVVASETADDVVPGGADQDVGVRRPGDGAVRRGEQGEGGEEHCHHHSRRRATGFTPSLAGV